MDEFQLIGIFLFILFLLLGTGVWVGLAPALAARNPRRFRHIRQSAGRRMGGGVSRASAITYHGLVDRTQQETDKWTTC